MIPIQYVLIPVFFLVLCIACIIIDNVDYQKRLHKNLAIPKKKKAVTLRGQKIIFALKDVNPFDNPVEGSD